MVYGPAVEAIARGRGWSRLVDVCRSLEGLMRDRMEEGIVGVVLGRAPVMEMGD